MNNRPSDTEVAALTGYNLPVEEITSFPTTEEQTNGGFILKYLGPVVDGYQAFLKTKNGILLSIVLIVHGLISFAGDVFTGATYLYNASAPVIEQIETFVYSYTDQDISPEYLVVIPEESTLQLPVKNWSDIPVDTIFAPASSISYFPPVSANT